MLDYGFRSKCCKAPIRMGTKTIKKTNLKTKIWICCNCSTRDVDIITLEEAQSQTDSNTSGPKFLKNA